MVLPLWKWVNSIYALLIIAALLPMAIFAGVTLYVSLHKEQQVFKNELSAKARIFASLVNTELKEQIKIAAVFAAVPVFDPPVNIEDVAARADRVLKHQPLYLSVSLFDERMTRIYSSSPHPENPITPESVQEALLSGKAVIGAITRGPDGWGIPIRAPVIRNSKVVYVLSPVIGTEALNDVLMDIKIPAGWIGTVIDRDGSIVARNRAIHEWIGQSVSPAALEAFNRGGGIFYGQTKEGFDTIGALEIAPDFGWAVIIGLPLSIYNQPLDETRNFVVASAIITVILTTTFIILLAKEIKSRHAQAAALEQKFRLEFLGELTGRAAHDFNNLLTVIMGNVGKLEKATTSPRLDAIRGAAERGELANDLLSFSRGSAAELIDVELNEHLQRLVSSFPERFPTNITISFDLEKVNPLGLFLKVDPVQFDLAVLNIMINSCDAMSSGGRIDVITRKKQEWITLTIRDTGTGIPKEILPRIFDPFFTTKGANGTGFGLSQVYGFVKQADGTISVESNETGTAMTMRFPAVEKSYRKNAA